MLSKEIGNWKIERELGRGGMGEVWLAYHKTLHTPATVKVLAPALTHDPRFRERFYSEAKTQAALQHRNIARVYDFLEEDRNYFLVVEYLEGGGLDSKLGPSTGPLGESLALAWARQILEGLDHAHQRGIIHRDIKPSNIMLDSHNQAKLVDFGIAIAVGGRRMTATGVAAGTAHYMSPEQIRTPQQIDHRSDVYSVGIVLFEMLTGCPPFDDESDFELKAAHVNRFPPTLKSLNPAVSNELERIVLKALAKNPAERFAGCKEFIQTLEAYERKKLLPPELPVPNSPFTTPSVPASSLLRQFSGGIGVGIALTIVLGLAGFGTYRMGFFTNQAQLSEPAHSTTGTDSEPAHTPKVTVDGFTLNPCGSISDAKTGLEWFVGPNRNTTWSEASQWTHNLSVCGPGWRMPSKSELQTLYNPRFEAGSGFFTHGRYWRAHLHPMFKDIGGGAWVWTNQTYDTGKAISFNFNQGLPVVYEQNDTQYATRAFAVR